MVAYSDLTPDVLEFVTSSLPPAPAQVLEVGAGNGTLARHLSDLGYDVVAIDPAGDGANIRPVALAELDEPNGSFDAAVAVVSLHHVEPLEPSLARLADVLRPGAPLVIDEFDVEAFDAEAAAWWLAQQPEGESGHDPEQISGDVRHHLHRVEAILTALQPWFELGEPERGPYLYRWKLGPEARAPEQDAIAQGRIAATGARVVGRRRELS